MKFILFTLAVLFSVSTSSQIIGPDTVCVGTTAQFTSAYEAISYTWSLDTVDIIQTPSPITVAGSHPLVGGCFMTLNNDNGHYYSFVTAYSQNKVLKMDYGSSPLNTPTYTDMGTFGLSSGQTAGIDVVRDDNGNWFGFVTGGPQMLRLSFGTSLANTPTPTLWTYPAELQWPHQLMLKEVNNIWVAFVANRNGQVVRFDFGNSLATVPTVVAIPVVGNYSSPSNMALYNQSGNWHMLVTNLLANTITRLDFGSNLLNNNPTGVNLGNLGSQLQLPRGTSVLTDCDQQLISYTLNEDGSPLSLMDYLGNFTNIPSTTVSTSFMNGSIFNSLLPFTYNGVLYYLCSHTSQNVYRFSVLNYPPQTTTNYYNPNFSHTFTTTGTYNITLHCDQGFQQGPAAYCKQVVVVNSTTNVSLGNDTTLCGTSYTIGTNIQGTGNFLWSTGATTPTITVTSSGTYWVTATGPCTSGSDTINVVLQPTPAVNLGPNVTICTGQSTTLQSQGTLTNPSYVWSTGSTNPSITTNQAGTYWLQVTQGSCTGSDTIQVSSVNPPVISLGNDTSICANSYTIAPMAQNVTGYLWSTGATTPTITVTNSGTYWLSVTGGGNCPADADTINITLQQPPIVNLGNDTFICQGQSVTLQPQGSFNNPTYLWSTRSTAPSITVNQTGNYWVQVTQGLCTGMDNVAITVQAPPIVDLGDDTAFCANGSITLQPLNSYTNATYTWSTGSMTPSITVSQPGTYWLSVDVAIGCTGSDTINVTQKPVPVVSVDDTSICPGGSALVQAQGNFANPGYLWSNGSNSPSAVFTQPGSYWVEVTVEGCTGRDSMTLTLLSQPMADIVAADSLCPGANAILYSSLQVNAQYLWSTGSTADSTIAGTAGEYWLMITNAQGCNGGDTVTLYSSTAPYVQLPNDTLICDGEAIFIAPVSHTGTIVWNNNSDNYAIQISAGGTYYITATNGCGSATDSMRIDVQSCEIWLPNVFTPNGDGKNDIFRLVGNLSMVSELYFAVYDRFGERVFVTDNPYEGWDGIYRNMPQDVNSFGYMVKCKVGSKQVEMKGFMHLLR